MWGEGNEGEKGMRGIRSREIQAEELAMLNGIVTKFGAGLDVFH
jgi:hypothetical protein